MLTSNCETNSSKTMDLKFLGRGAAFNPKEGNTSAYFIENDELFLIDCGESVFDKLFTKSILNGIKNINVMITHTHSDHIGSLGTLVMYSFFVLHKPLNIILPEHAKHLTNIENILSGFGCTEAMYNYVMQHDFDNKYKSFDNIRYIETDHCDDLDCYSLIFSTPCGIIYYSGDTRNTDIIKSIIESDKPIYKLYIDTTTANFPGNVHLYIELLKNVIPDNLSDKVYCMHLNNDSCIEQAKQLRFNVVETI